MKFFDAKLSQTSGELTPLLAGRADLAAYQNGAKEMTNCIVLPQGGFTNRPGTRLIDNGFVGARIIPFVLNVDFAWVITFKPDYSIWIYNKTGRLIQVEEQYEVEIEVPVYDAAGDQIGTEIVIEIRYRPAVHPYNASELAELRYLQSNNIIFLFQREHRPKQIHRRADLNKWLWDDIPLIGGPFGEYNTNPDRRLTITREGFNFRGIMTANWNAFSPDMVGKLIRVEFRVPPSSSTEQLSRTTWDPGMIVDIFPFGATTIEAQGRYVGTIEVRWMRVGTPGPGQVYYSHNNVNGLNPMGFSFVNNDYSDQFSLRLLPDGRAKETLAELQTITGSVNETWWVSGVNNSVNLFYYWNGTNWVPSINQINVIVSYAGGIARRDLVITAVLGQRQVRVEAVSTAVPLYSTPHDSNMSNIISWSTEMWGGPGGWPALGAFHQERLILANTRNDPTTIWMSRVASWFDFGPPSDPAEDTDPITITLASKQANEITALSSREDLLIFTAGAEFVAKAGGAREVFTPSSVIIVPTGYRGSRFMDVLEIGAITLFVQRHGNVVRGMGYNLEIDGYSANELSILSEHMFEGKFVTQWAYQQYPWSIAWMVLNDGQLLALTFHEEHQVAAWTKHILNDRVRDICVIPGHGQDDVYMIVGNILVHFYPRNDIIWNTAMFQDQGQSYKMVYESLELEQVQAQGTLQGREKQNSDLTLRLFRTCGLKAGIITENSTELDMIEFPDQVGPGYKSQPWTGDVYLKPPGGMGKICRLRIESDQATPLTVIGIWRGVEVPE